MRIGFSVVDDDNEALASPAKLVSSAAIPKGTLVAGYRLVVRVPHTTQRYIGVTFTPGTINTTGGTFSAFLAKDVPVNVNFPAGSTIL